MRGDPLLGTVLREMRTSQGLTLAVTARRVSCAESLLSQVETGGRVLQPWLATALDHAYGTGGTIAALCGNAAYPGMSPTDRQPAPTADVLLVQVPLRGITVPISRRDLMAAVGLGAVTGTLDGLRRAAAVPADEELLAALGDSLHGLQAAGRIMPPHRLIDPLTGQVGLIEVARRHAPAALADEFLRLQTRYAESLSWMAEEAGDLHAAVYWTDRAHQWANQLQWTAMAAYSYVRRSMLAISYTSDGHAAAEQATHALRIRRAPARIRGLAAKQLAYGHALAGQHDACKQALDLTVHLFDLAERRPDEDGPMVGQRSVGTPDLLAIYQGTCQTYLGGGEQAITTLTPHLAGIGGGSRRTHTITSAKLAQAYAHAGAPDQACAHILAALDAHAAVDSVTTRAELRRTLPLLRRWPNRADVAEVRHRLTELG